MSRGAEGTTEASGRRDQAGLAARKRRVGAVRGAVPAQNEPKSDRPRAKTPMNRRKSRLRRRAAPILRRQPATQIRGCDSRRDTACPRAGRPATLSPARGQCAKACGEAVAPLSAIHGQVALGWRRPTIGDARGGKTKVPSAAHQARRRRSSRLEQAMDRRHSGRGSELGAILDFIREHTRFRAWSGSCAPGTGFESRRPRHDGSAGASAGEMRLFKGRTAPGFVRVLPFEAAGSDPNRLREAIESAEGQVVQQCVSRFAISGRLPADKRHWSATPTFRDIRLLQCRRTPVPRVPVG